MNAEFQRAMVLASQNSSLNLGSSRMINDKTKGTEGLASRICRDGPLVVWEDSTIAVPKVVSCNFVRQSLEPHSSLRHYPGIEALPRQ